MPASDEPSGAPLAHYFLPHGQQRPTPTTLGLGHSHRWRFADTTTHYRYYSRPYQYNALPTEDSIRILRLQPGPAESPLSITLEASILPAIDAYEAISYVWGDPNDIEYLSMPDGSEIAITKNLGNALRAFRKTDGPRALWADAICINQHDFEERSQQVQRMGEIYAQAEVVLVWLGTVATNLKDLNCVIHALSHSTSEDEHMGRKDVVCSDSMGRVQSSTWVIQQLVALGSAKWFDRVWTMQELGLARTARLCCQDDAGAVHTFDWEDVSTAFRMAPHRAIKTALVRSKWDNIYGKMLYLHKWWKESVGGVSTLADLLERVRHQETTDSRDRVFAMLSHPYAWTESKPRHLIIRPDYTKSCAEVYRELARNTIIEQGKLDILSHVDQRSVAARDPRLPSWVPDWRVQIVNWQRVKDAVYFFPWDACGIREKLADMPPSYWLPTFGSDGTLSTFGICLGTIVWQSGTLRPQDFPESAQERQWPEDSILRGAWAYLRTQELSPKQRPLEDLLVSTLLCGSTPLSWPLEEEGVQKNKQTLLWAYRASILNHFPAEDLPDEQLDEKRLQDFLDAVRRRCMFRNLFLTDTGFLGLGPAHIIVGCKVFVLRGGRVPFVLAPTTRSRVDDLEPDRAPEEVVAPLRLLDCYRFAGECFVDGYMYGEAVGIPEQEVHVI